MIYLLDTNAVIALLAKHPVVDRRVRGGSPEDFCLSAIVSYELHYGARKSVRKAQNTALLEKLGLAVLDFTGDDARSAASVRAKLEAAGTPIGPYDVLIAGQALARGLTLVTRNTREFSRVDDLVVEDWERS